MMTMTGSVTRHVGALSIQAIALRAIKAMGNGYTQKSDFRRGLNILCRLVADFEQFDFVVWRKVI